MGESLGRVPVTAEVKIENLADAWAAEKGRLLSGRARSATVTDAPVDAAAIFLCIPTAMIKRLGLEPVGTRRERTVSGVDEVRPYDAVRLTIQGRTCTMDVREIADGNPVLIGQLVLGHLDFVVDLRSRSLVGNPAHGGEHIYEV
ncbi:hypothetical protein OJF2_29360 [Aquisphaera giovannonii]|uniref:Aspartyl protease n=1 Tax=Aquisphaera giovannonii TaxID=406548 RepID=A0A5B9W2G3_9BACT|nr:hypothetical protein [Aquisphaera giovannonii]QEH34397.1 hypothetical protein OJF2_29360 [Aquisphaera giovannonii]